MVSSRKSGNRRYLGLAGACLHANRRLCSLVWCQVCGRRRVSGLKGKRLGPVMKTIVENCGLVSKNGTYPALESAVGVSARAEIEPCDLVPGFELAPNRDKVVATFLH